jgi:hypothetical protein
VRVEREIVWLDFFRGFGVSRVVEQDRAQDGLLGVDVGGQSGVEAPEIRNGGHVVALRY